MHKKRLAQIEAIAFSLYLQIKSVRKEAESAEERKQDLKAKLVFIRGGKPDDPIAKPDGGV